jgi:hypothetical protein
MILTGCRVVLIEADRVGYEREDGSSEAVAADRVALAIGWVSRGCDLVPRLNGRPERRRKRDGAGGLRCRRQRPERTPA